MVCAQNYEWVLNATMMMHQAPSLTHSHSHFLTNLSWFLLFTILACFLAYIPYMICKWSLIIIGLLWQRQVGRFGCSTRVVVRPAYIRLGMWIVHCYSFHPLCLFICCANLFSTMFLIANVMLVIRLLIFCSLKCMVDFVMPQFLIKLQTTFRNKIKFISPHVTKRG